MKIRSGIGYDVHRLVPGDELPIGGVRIGEGLGFEAHSDGDVLLHALMDSLLGAIGERDIGELFPDSDERYRDADSRTLLAEVLKIVERKNFEIMGIDSVIIAQIPRISPVKDKIRKNVAALLGLDEDAFNLKAKTKENMDAAGRGECIECYCISMVRSRD